MPRWAGALSALLLLPLLGALPVLAAGPRTGTQGAPPPRARRRCT
uniref:Uncharacterized protein n=1 Tax=Ornithorhynchus anatinus TaxID=9258 RepID=A0A6I8PG39_ORNAN